MPFPVSRNRVDKLGEQLVIDGFVRADHRELFSQILGYYQYLLDTVAEQISACGYEPTTRLKTTGTLIEKLSRERGIKLSRIQDVAGARIIVGRLRIEQDQAVAKIIKAFEGLKREPSVVDRRVDPRYGYRAIHVIVYPEGVPVEIQVRTMFQNMWAQIFENLADQWGRQIRYGKSPSSSTPDRAQILNDLAALGEIIANYESTATEIVINQESVKAAVASLRESLNDLEQFEPTSVARDSIKDGYVSLRVQAIKMCCLFEADKRRRGRIIRRRCPGRENPALADVNTLANWLVTVATKRLTDINLELTRREEELTRREEELRSILTFLVEKMNEVH